MDSLITIVTTVYNRADMLKNLYESLKAQKCQNFCWLVIDDGSTDNCRETVGNFISENCFSIKYFFKNNGGKHTALNYAFDHINSELTFIVDSDDTLTTDATYEIEKYYRQCNSPEIAGISFLRKYKNDKIIGKEFPVSESTANDIYIRLKKKTYGDKAEVWKSSILTKYRFPEYSNEKFMGENYIWWQIACEYAMYYVNKAVYVTEYLEGGLSKQGRSLRISCPKGGMDNSAVSLGNKFPLKIRIKSAILFDTYGKFDNLSFFDIIKKAGKHRLITALNYPFGFLLHIYWKKKYLR